MPSPSSGAFLIAMLKKLESLPLNSLYLKQRDAYYDSLIQALDEGFRQRSLYGGDSRFSSVGSKKPPSPETTHFSIMDNQGNAVASTQSINYLFGARLMLPNWGIVLNDTMDDFSSSPGKPNVYGLIGGKANAIAPSKTPLSSMSPTFLFDQKGVRLALGAPGGSQILSAILQAIVHDVDLKMHPFASVARGRIHYQYKPQTVFAEKEALSKEQKKQLEKRGYAVQTRPLQAKLFLVKRDKDSLVGVSDPRGNGRPAGSNLEYPTQKTTK